MKQISNPLLQYLLSTNGESTYFADLIFIQLATGQQFQITNGQANILYDENIYYAGKWGSWDCTTTSCELGCVNATASLQISADDDTILPGWDIPLMQAIQEGLFDAAIIIIRTTFGFVYGETDMGTVIRFSGQITELHKTGRTTAEGEAKPYTFTLNQPMPRNVIQPNCGWVFGSQGCTVNLSLFTYPNSVGAGTNNVYIVPATPISLPSGVTLTQGVITMTSGRNNGLSMGIQQYDGTSIRLNRPFLFPVALGDTFNVTAGCAHTAQSCFVYQGANSYINFGGQLYIPNKEAAL